MTIPYRDEQILRILEINRDGLTTAEIFNIAKTQRGNELPDANITSQRIYSLRTAKNAKISSHESIAGRIHKITDAGRAALAEIGRTTPCHATSTADTIAESAPDPEPQTDILQQFDQAVDIIRNGLITALSAQVDSVRIAEKSRKLSTLEQLENLPIMSSETAAIIAAIRADLEQLEERTEQPA